MLSNLDLLALSAGMAAGAPVAPHAPALFQAHSCHQWSQSTSLGMEDPLIRYLCENYYKIIMTHLLSRMQTNRMEPVLYCCKSVLGPGSLISTGAFKPDVDNFH